MHVSPPGTLVTIEEGRAFLETNKEAGSFCPCCDRLDKVYKRALNSRMARGLIWLYFASDKGAHDVALSTAPAWLLQTNELATTRYWGFIVQAPKEEGDLSRRTSGVWNMHQRGILAVERKITFPRRVHTYRGEVIGWDEHEIYIDTAVGVRFNYPKLMSARGQ